MGVKKVFQASSAVPKIRAPLAVRLTRAVPSRRSASQRVREGEEQAQQPVQRPEVAEGRVQPVAVAEHPAFDVAVARVVSEVAHPLLGRPDVVVVGDGARAEAEQRVPHQVQGRAHLGTTAEDQRPGLRDLACGALLGLLAEEPVQDQGLAEVVDRDGADRDTRDRQERRSAPAADLGPHLPRQQRRGQEQDREVRPGIGHGGGDAQPQGDDQLGAAALRHPRQPERDDRRRKREAVLVGVGRKQRGGTECETQQQPEAEGGDRAPLHSGGPWPTA